MLHLNLMAKIRLVRMRACVVLTKDGWSTGSAFNCWRSYQWLVEWIKLCLDLSFCFAYPCPKRGWRGLSSCLVISNSDETCHLICDGAIPHIKYRDRFTIPFFRWKITKIISKSADNQSEVKISLAYDKNSRLSLIKSLVKRGPRFIYSCWL